jgi:hypothetical protein
MVATMEKVLSTIARVHPNFSRLAPHPILERAVWQFIAPLSAGEGHENLYGQHALRWGEADTSKIDFSH